MLDTAFLQLAFEINSRAIYGVHIKIMLAWKNKQCIYIICIYMKGHRFLKVHLFPGSNLCQRTFWCLFSFFISVNHICSRLRRIIFNGTVCTAFLHVHSRFHSMRAKFQRQYIYRMLSIFTSIHIVIARWSYRFCANTAKRCCSILRKIEAKIVRSRLVFDNLRNKK